MHFVAPRKSTSPGYNNDTLAATMRLCAAARLQVHGGDYLPVDQRAQIHWTLEQEASEEDVDVEEKLQPTDRTIAGGK